MKIIRIWYTTFLLSLHVAHKTVCEKNGVLLEFMLFPDKSELRKKWTRGTHATVSVDFYLSNEPTWCTKLLFYNKFFHASTCFEHCVLIIRRSKLYYTASGIITPVGDRPVSQHGHGNATYRYDDTRGCVMQFWPPDDKHMCSKHVLAWNKLTVKQKF